MEILQDIQYGPLQSEKLDVYIPENNNSKTIVYFHGGGICNGDKADEWCVEMAKYCQQNGCIYVSVNYSLYPSTAFPKFLEEAALSISFVKDHLGKWGGNSDIYVMGQSAGAYMSLMLALDSKYLNDVGMSPLDIKGWLIDSAQTTAHFNVISLDTGLDSRLQIVDERAPLYFVNKDTKFTKIKLVFYTEDMSCRYEQNMLFYKAILAFNQYADITYNVLDGGHCSGSTVKVDGVYPVGKLLLDFIKE